MLQHHQHLLARLEYNVGLVQSKYRVKAAVMVKLVLLLFTAFTALIQIQNPVPILWLKTLNESFFLCHFAHH